MLLRSLVIVRLCVERTCSIASLVYDFVDWFRRQVEAESAMRGYAVYGCYDMVCRWYFCCRWHRTVHKLCIQTVRIVVNIYNVNVNWTRIYSNWITFSVLSSALFAVSATASDQCRIGFCVCVRVVCVINLLLSPKRKKRKSASGSRSDRSTLMWQHKYLIQYSAATGEIVGCWSRTIHHEHHRCRQTTVFVCECAWPSYRFSIGTTITMRI